MIDFESAMLLASGATLGVFLGAQLVEACVFVPIWKRIRPDDFFQHRELAGPLSFQLFAVSTIVATIIPWFHLWPGCYPIRSLPYFFG
ncbi:MAG: hypothetical protein GY743_09170 [Planctomycetaceae bacterium]|nr:hypothetical protein [Planctomycetaceae bacterium]